MKDTKEAIRHIVVRNVNGETILDSSVGDTWKGFTIVDINTSTSNPAIFDFEDEVLTEEKITNAVEITTYSIKLRGGDGLDHRINSHQEHELIVILEKNGSFVACKEPKDGLIALCQATDFEVTY